MAYQGSLFRWKNEKNEEVGKLVFDAIISEEHDIDNKVTAFPVDTGFIVSDHVIRKNRTLKMEVCSVNHHWEGRRRESYTSSQLNKIKADFDVLTELVQKGHKVDVVTMLGVYSNCVVRRFTTKQDVDTSTVMKAVLILEELNIVGEVETEAAKRALIDMASQPTGVDTEQVLKDLLGDDYDELEGSNNFGGF